MNRVRVNKSPWRMCRFHIPASLACAREVKIEFGSEPRQKLTVAPNWNSRGSPVLFRFPANWLIGLPAFPVNTLVFKLLNVEWFQVLKASALNCRFARSVNLNIL